MCLTSPHKRYRPVFAHKIDDSYRRLAGRAERIKAGALEAAGLVVFRRLYERYIDSADDLPAAPRMAAYVAALLDRYPDIDTDEGDDSPWSSAPLLNEVTGLITCFPMVWSRCQEISSWAARLTFERGLGV